MGIGGILFVQPEFMRPEFRGRVPVGYRENLGPDVEVPGGIGIDVVRLVEKEYLPPRASGFRFVVGAEELELPVPLRPGIDAFGLVEPPVVVRRLVEDVEEIPPRPPLQLMQRLRD